MLVFRPAPFTFYTTMSEKRAAEGAPEIAEKKAKHAEDEEENVAEEEDIEEEENEEEGDEEDDVEGVSNFKNNELFGLYSLDLETNFYFNSRREKRVKMKKARKMMVKKVKRRKARKKGKETNKSCFYFGLGGILL